MKLTKQIDRVFRRKQFSSSFHSRANQKQHGFSKAFGSQQLYATGKWQQMLIVAAK